MAHKTLATVRARWGQPVDRERQMPAIAASHRSRVTNLGSSGSLDDRTWEDLNLDAVFAALDRTESTLGQHALYHRIRTAPVADHLALFETLVTRLEADAGLRERAQLALGRLRDPHGYDLWWLARPDAIETRPWYAFFPVLTAVTVLLLVLAPITAQVIPALIAAVVINIVVRYATDRRIGAVAGAFRQIAPVIATGQALRFLGADKVEPLIGSLQVDGPRLRQLKTIARWVSGDPLMLSLSAGPFAVVVSDVANSIYEYLNLAFLLDANGVYFGARALSEHRTGLLRLVMAIGEVDAAISVASFRAGRNDWARPHLQPACTPATLADIRHPLVADAVPNSISLELGGGVLITGSNMSGKSTFLRTVGVTTVLAQTLNTCLATTYDAPVFNVRTCIGRSDDLVTGKSYYIAEVESLLGLVTASTGAVPHLFLLDELFRGTNAIERIAAAQAVLQELVAGSSGPKPHVVLAATHDGELVDLLPDSYAAHHFGDAIGPAGLTFDHRLKTGPATTRNAIALLQLHGAPEELIRRALRCAEALDRQRGTTLVARQS